MSQCSTWKLSFGLAVAAVALTFTSTTVAFAQSNASVVVTVPAANAEPLITAKVDETKLAELPSAAIPEGARDLGPASGEMKLGMQLVLRRSQVQEDALKLLNQQSLNSTSPLYGKTLTPAEFAKTFGLAASDLETLKSSLVDAGFTVGNVDNGRLTIDFEGTVAVVNAAFHTEIHNYAAADGTQHYAPAIALQIPKALGPAIHRVAGLQNFTTEERQSFNGPVVDFGGATKKVEAQASGKNLTPILVGEALHDASFTASKYVLGLKGVTTLNVRIGGSTHSVTGSLAIEDQNDRVVGFVPDITRCEAYGSYGRSCTADYKPPVGSVWLRAVYSGDENVRGAVVPLTIISFVGSSLSNISSTGVTTAPLTTVFTGTASATVTTVISYLGNAANPSATAPTGTITIVYYNTSVTWASLTLGTTSGSGTSAKGNAYTYSCPAANTTTQTVTCTVTMANAYADVQSQGEYGGFNLTATYNGDTNYNSSIGYAFLYGQRHTSTVAATYSASTTAPSSTYGTAPSVVATVSLSASTSGNNACGSGTYPAFLDFHSVSGTGTVATPYEMGNIVGQINGDCSTSGGNYVIPAGSMFTLTLPAWIAPGTYTVASDYTGNAGSSTASFITSPVAATGSDTFMVGKYTPTLGSASATPNSVAQGSATAVTLSGTMTVPAVGVLPSGTLNYIVNGANYAATCVYTSTAGSLGCSATIPASTVSALGFGTYPITSSFAGDGFYASATGSGGNLVVYNTTSALTAVPATEVYAGGTAVALTDTLTFATGVTPVGTDTITFTNSAGVTAIGSMTISQCSVSGQVYTCTFNWTPPAGATGDNVGSYTITAAFSGDSGTNPSSATTPFSITKQTPTFGTMTFSPAASEPYGTAQAITISDTLNFTGGGLAPTGAVKYVLNGVSYTATCTGSTSPLTCSATVPAATIAALAINAYTVTAAYTTDTNYAAATGTSGTFTITTGVLSTIQMTTSAYATPPTPTTQPYGTTTAFTVYAALAPTGTVAPTPADVTFAVTGGTATGTFGTTACAVVSGVDHCSASFTPSGTAIPGSYEIEVSFQGDTHYGAAGPSTNGAGLYVVTNATPILTFSPSPISSVYQSTIGIPVTVTVSPSGVTGTVNFTGSYATYGTLSATSCVLSAGSCSVTFTPNGTTAIGTYSNILTATLPASGYFNTAIANDSLTITGGTTTLAVTVNPIDYFSNATSGTFTTVLSWVNPSAQPTGTITVSNPTSGKTFGGITLPTGTNSIASGTACTTAGTKGACTYACSAANTTTLTFTCTVTNTIVAGTLSSSNSNSLSEANTVLATYNGDTNFGTATGNTYLYSTNGTNSASAPGTVVVSGTAIASSTYGLTTAESPTVKITTHSNETIAANGSVFLDIYGAGQVGTPYEYGLSSCGSSPCTVVTSWNTPAVLSPSGSPYVLNYTYSGNYESLSGQTTVTTFSSTGTGNLIVNKQTPTFGAVGFSPAASEPYGTNQAITVSTTLNWLGVGEVPQGAVTFTFVNSSSTPISGSPFAAVCGSRAGAGSGNGQTNNLTCTATVPGTTIAGLAAGTYTVTPNYATDANYGVATGASGTFTITPLVISSIVLSADTPGSTSGGVTSVNLTATITPALAGVTVTFNDATTGMSFSGATNSSGQVTITADTSDVPFVAAGLNAVSASVTGTSNYSSAGPSNTVNIYLQGLLVTTLAHDFSVCYTNPTPPGTPVVGCGQAVSPADTVGTLNGSPICNGSNGVLGYTCTAGDAVVVTNWTSAAVPFTLNFTKMASGALSRVTNCPTAPATLAAGANCTVIFYYNPPYGDGSSSTVGTYEAGGWSITGGGLTGVGIVSGGVLGSRSGSTGFPTPAVLAGFAVLQPGALGVSAQFSTFPAVAPGVTSNTLTITVTNANPAPVNFTVTGPAAPFTMTSTCASSLAANAVCQIYVTLESSTPGNYSSSVVVTPSGGSAIPVNFSGSVVANALVLNTNSHNFGNVTLNTTQTFNLSVTNSSGAAANVSVVDAGASGYTVTTSCPVSPATLANGAVCGVTVTLDPTGSAGAYNDTVTIGSTTTPIVPGGLGSGPYSSAVSFTANAIGSGSGYFTASTVGHNWGTVNEGTNGGNYGVQLSNGTASAVTLSYTNPLPTEGFTLVGSSCGSSLAVNATCELIFNFSPTGTGFVTATYGITGSVPLYAAGDTSDTYSGITLKGTGQ